MTDAQKSMTFEECVKAAKDGAHTTDVIYGIERLAKSLRPLFDELTTSRDAAITTLEIKAETKWLEQNKIKEQQATITELREKLREVLDGWPTIKRQDKTIGQLREVIIRFDRYSHGEEADADALLNELDKAMKSFALSEQPEGEKDDSSKTE